MSGPMSGPMADLLREGLAQLEIPSTEQQIDKVQAFLEELERWNRRYGFVARSGPSHRQVDRRQLVIRHVLDSLSAWSTIKAIEHRNQVADVGSGAGFPGIPLAVFLPDSRFTLLEPSARKSAFLRNVAILAELRNVEVLEARLEDVVRRFDLVVFRAFSPLSRASLAALQRVLEPNGSIVAYKGKRARIEGELTACGLDARSGNIVAVPVPFLDEERHLVIVPKISSAS
jgi:16S rRNA (guanine527-N7)-methyltransferase